MTKSSERIGLGPSCVAAIALFLVSSSILPAQPLASALLSTRAAGPDSSSPPALAPLPADVLNPNTRQNTPYLKIAARAGFNWAAYSNDRYLDNTALDVGQTSGEQDVYSHASGFGFGGGAEIEYPINTGISVVGSVEFMRAEFGREGTVHQEIERADGSAGVGLAQHEWSASISYLKFGATAKLAFPSFYLLAGLTADRVLTSQIVRSRTLDDASHEFPGTGSNSLEEDGPMVDPSGLHFAIRTGFGLTYPIAEGLQFSPELTLDFGTGSINKSPESDLDIYSVSAVLRYELR